MKIKKILVTICLLMSVHSFIFAQSSVDYKIEFIGRPVFDDISKVDIRFNLLDPNTNKRIPIKYENANIEISDVRIGKVEKTKKGINAPRFVTGSFKSKEVSGQNNDVKSGVLNANEITVSVLVDRSGSMTQTKIDKVNEVLFNLLKSMPDGSVFISSFSNDVRTSLPYSKEDLNSEIITIHNDPANSHTALFNAIYTKLLEFDSTSVIPNLDYELDYSRTGKIYKRNTPQNYLIVITDGKNDTKNIQKYSDNDFLKIDKEKLLKTVEANRNKDKNVEIWMIGIKDGGDDRFYDEETMKSICKISGKEDNYRRGGVDELKKIGGKVIDNLLPDYQFTIQYPAKSRFTGSERQLKIQINFPDGKKARGTFNYIKGSKASPFIVNPPTIYEVLIKGFLLGIVFLIIIVILIQVIVPLTRSFLFKVKYVKKYKPDLDTEKQSCTWCKDEIIAGEKAVFRCEHISHWKCWKENNHQCPNYPDICGIGKQDYFDINDPFAKEDTNSIVKQNKKRFMRWIVAGIIAGLLTWILYELFLHWKFHHIFDVLITKLVPSGLDNHFNYIEKYTPLLWVGIILGFFLSGFFLYLEEFRRVNFLIALKLLLRAIIGSVIGFIAFFIGSLILIKLKVDQTQPILDIIPWVIFGPLVGYYLSVKTTLSAIHGLIGGLFSILFSFFTLYLFRYAEEYLIVFSFALYGAGLGAAISTIRQMAEKFFLVLSNAPVKNKEFPLHKWISKSADYGAFTIGRGNKNMIKMDWEKEGTVSDDVHAVIYLEKSNKDFPVITIRDTNNKTYLNEHILMRPEKEYLLHTGDTFKIGETIFKYEEKQG